MARPTGEEQGSVSAPSDRVPARARLSGKDIAAAVLAAIGIAFAALNSQEVTVHWLVTTTTAPLVVVILVSGVLGAATAALVRRRRRK